MLLELTEILACPACGPQHGLIAFVDRMEDRRIEAGHVDCPICEERHEIRSGAVWFGESRESPPTRTGAGDPEAEAATASALLGVPAPAETVLLGPGAAGLAAAIAELRPSSTVVTYDAARAPVHGRVHSLVDARNPEDAPKIPLRSACVDGVVLAGDARRIIAEAARILRPGARLVVLDPGGEALRIDDDVPLNILAADSRAWVGSRS